MNLIVIQRLNKIKLYDFVIYNGYMIKLKYENQIYDALTQHFDFYSKPNTISIQ